MTARTICLRCGGARLIPAHLEQATALCVDHAAHHGVLRVGLKASLCEECGHVELWLPDPHVLGAAQHARSDVRQEADV